jgi:alpha-beta hydrolase superfamily lysophospholipase
MTSVSCHEGVWTHPASGHRLFYRLWRPQDVHHLVVILHGFGEHGGRYLEVGARLAEQGIGVVAPDLIGHGRSDGQRGDLDVRQCVEALARLTDSVWLSEFTLKHYAVFGHSFGGLVAIQWALEAPSGLHRLVLQAPLLEAGFHIPHWKVAAARVFALLWPTWPLSTGLDAGALSRDPGVVEAYVADPLVHRVMSARTYAALVRAWDDAVMRAEQLHVPTLFLCGLADRIISVEAAHRWFDRLLCEKRRMTFPGCYHELHHEPVRDEALRAVADWVRADG